MKRKKPAEASLKEKTGCGNASVAATQKDIPRHNGICSTSKEIHAAQLVLRAGQIQIFLEHLLGHTAAVHRINT